MFKKNKVLEKKLDLLLNSLEKSNLTEIAYILGNKKQIFWRNTVARSGKGNRNRHTVLH